MRIIDKMRRQAAIYWPPTGAVDRDYGRQGVGALVPLTLQAGGDYRVRWEEVVQEFRSADGTVLQSNAMVYVPRLPGGGEVQVGGWLWLGVEGDLADAAVPANNPRAFPIRRFDRLPTLKATKYLRTAYL